MPVFAQIGFLTTLLKLTATMIGEGIVVGGFVAAAVGVVVGRSRQEMEGNALRDGFWGGAGGMLCLCIDLLSRYSGQ
jgi:hypothetical protein